MSLTGRRLGPYEILAPLGAGGMGEVYRARDTKLSREVAIKVLPADLASDPERLARFQREAQLLAALNHPNIAIIHGLEDSDGAPALVLELVEGPTLADRIAAGALPMEEAVQVARQIAAALEAAHQHGIVHRDLKPSNIKITPSGAVKVLDFGLAKLVEPAEAGPYVPGGRGAAVPRNVGAGFSRPDATASPTMTSPAMMTGVGVILGTAAYMAPEQARGLAVDKRADIWAFGCVLYEMLTGTRLFEGRDVTDTLASVLKVEPRWSALPSNTRQALRRLLRRTLEKDPDERLHDIADARLELEEAFREPEPAVGRADAAKHLIGVVVMLAAAVGLTAVLAGAIVWWLMWPGPSPVRRLAIPIDAAAPLGTTNDPNIAISSDGSRLVYVIGAQAGGVGQSSLMLRALDRVEPVPIEGTASAHSPILSPDGQWVAFFADSDATLKKVPLAGGPPVTITKAPSPHLGASWGSDGTIVFAGPGLSRVSDAGGMPAVITTPDPKRSETRHAFPDILPNNRAVLFTVTADNASRVEVLRFDTGERQVVIENANAARYVPTGHLIFSQGGRLFAVAFDQDQLRSTGQPVPVLEGVSETLDGPGVFAISGDGSLVYLPGAGRAAVERTLAWVDLGGHEEPLPARPRPYSSVRVSPDGTRLAMQVDDQENTDIWVHDLNRHTQTRLTFDPGAERFPLWSPDGRRVLFASESALFVKSADGTGEAERVANDLKLPIPFSWSRDGKSILLQMGAPPDIYLLSLGGEPKPQPLVETQFAETRPAISPDGRWIAYQSNESGRNEVYVQPFPDVRRGRWQISIEGGDSAVWAPDGRQLFFRRGGAVGATLMGVAIEAGEAFTAGTPKALFDRPYSFSGFGFGRMWDIAPDGRRFLMLQEDALLQSNRAGYIVIVQNWFEELKRLVPAR